VKREREELLDFVLGELDPERGRHVAERIARDPEAAADRDRYEEAVRLVRAAAAAGWEAPARGRARLYRLRPALAAAAIIAAVALGIFLTSGRHHPATVYEPDVALGYARAEETDARGAVREPSTAQSCRLRLGEVEIAAIGSDRDYPLRRDEPIPLESEVKNSAEGGARIDLPDGGILFLGELSTVRLRRHRQGGLALRLLDGAACTIAGRRPLHLAVDGTDLLLRQESGAALLRKRPAEVVALRGDLLLLLEEGRRFRVPEAERLPAACAKEPATTAVRDEELDLDWYRNLVFAHWKVQELKLDAAGRSGMLGAGPEAMLYLRLVPPATGTLTITYGAEPREFALHREVPLRLRLRLSDLGPGPTLVVAPVQGLKEARLLEVEPRE
jgi:hypothetical protein